MRKSATVVGSEFEGMRWTGLKVKYTSMPVGLAHGVVVFDRVEVWRKSFGGSRDLYIGSTV